MTEIFLLDIREIINAPVDDYMKFFAPERQREILRKKFNSDRNRTVFAELLARKKIADIMGKDFHDITISRDENGRPFCNVAGIFFSLSHSGNFTACSVGDNPCGVDVENISRRINLNIAKRFYLPEEYETLKFLHDPGQDWRQKFFEYWTIKESALKCFNLREWTGVNCEELLRSERARNFLLNDEAIIGVCCESGELPEKIQRDLVRVGGWEN